MENAGFNNFDLLAVGLLLLTGILAFRRGLVKEIFMLATWTIAAVVAATFYPALTPWMMEHNIKPELAAKAASVVALFAMSLLVLIPTGNFLAGLIKGPTLTSIDRSLGFVFGLLKGFLILCLLFLAFGFVWPKEEEQPEWLAKARIKPVLADGTDMLKNFVPKEDRERAEEKLKKTQEEAQKAVDDAQHLEEISTPVPAWLKKNNEKATPPVDELP